MEAWREKGTQYLRWYRVPFIVYANGNYLSGSFIKLSPILVSNDLEVLLCLLTGKTILRKSSSSPGNHANYAEVSRFLNNDFNGSFSVFLVLNGSNASQVIIGDTEFNKFYTLRPFYTDKVGDKDVGMKRGSLLYLNEPIIEEIIDEILSGSWTNSF